MRIAFHLLYGLSMGFKIQADLSDVANRRSALSPKALLPIVLNRLLDLSQRYSLARLERR